MVVAEGSNRKQGAECPGERAVERPQFTSPSGQLILVAYGGVFVAGSLAWGMVHDGFRPDAYDVAGALICLAGVAVIMYAPAFERSQWPAALAGAGAQPSTTPVNGV